MCLPGSEHFQVADYFQTYSKQLYTGRPPFYDISEAKAMFRVIAGERPLKPFCDPAISEALWQYVNDYWMQDYAKRPATDIVVQQMGLNYSATLYR
jgi:hypothetical protein